MLPKLALREQRSFFMRLNVNATAEPFMRPRCKRRRWLVPTEKIWFYFATDDINLYFKWCDQGEEEDKKRKQVLARRQKRAERLVKRVRKSLM